MIQRTIEEQCRSLRAWVTSCLLSLDECVRRIGTWDVKFERAKGLWRLTVSVPEGVTADEVELARIVLAMGCPRPPLSMVGAASQMMQWSNAEDVFGLGRSEESAP